MGRNAAGVLAMKIRSGDRIECLAALDKRDRRDLLVVSEKGLGKRTPLVEYTAHGRNTQGIKTLEITERNGPVVGVLVVDPNDEIMCITKQGVLIRMPVEKIRQTGRSAQGVKVVNVGEGDLVVAVTKVVQEAGESPEDAA